MRIVRPISRLVAIAACGSLLACVHSVRVGNGGPPPSGPTVVREGNGHGPPPWAPAHGYRRHHQRAYQHRDATVDLVFDSGLGVYIVVGIPDHYYWNGVYLRLESGAWWRAPYLDARWSPCPTENLPGKLSSKPVKAKGKGHAKHRGRN